VRPSYPLQCLFAASRLGLQRIKDDLQDPQGMAFDHAQSWKPTTHVLQATTQRGLQATIAWGERSSACAVRQLD